IDQALSLVAALRRVGLDRNAWTGEAAEACLSLEALIGQVHGRLERLRNLNDEPGLSGLLRNELTPSLNAAAAAARTAYTTAGLDPVAEISAAQWVLSPSDFGLHNALRRADGRLIFIDFEYFGWDDPVKLTADFLWHPGMSLSDQEADCWWAGMLDLFADNPTFAVRLAAQAPLFAIRWCLIILNEFLPERWRRRVFAGGSAGDWMTAKAAQLVKARALLSRASIGGAALPSTNTTRPTA
ncbi:aminoglycoside phosphotransferase family protein, partial [bacterium]|nr:aminoglycoside phosphotransferase family protein [bacterium]